MPRAARDSTRTSTSWTEAAQHARKSSDVRLACKQPAVVEVHGCYKYMKIDIAHEADRDCLRTTQGT